MMSSDDFWVKSKWPKIAPVKMTSHTDQPPAPDKGMVFCVWADSKGDSVGKWFYPDELKVTKTS